MYKYNHNSHISYNINTDKFSSDLIIYNRGCKKFIKII